MKACKVLEKLQVTRKTLNNYIKSGKIRVKQLNNGFYDYNENDVLQLEKDIVHHNKIVIYSDENIHEFNITKQQTPELIQLIIQYLSNNLE